MRCIQVKRAQAHLLEHLYAAVTTLGGAEAEYLLEEESESIVKREKLKQVSRSPPSGKGQHCTELGCLALGISVLRMWAHKVLCSERSMSQYMAYLAEVCSALGSGFH